MADWKLDKWIGSGGGWEQIRDAIGEVQTPELRQPAEAYLRNVIEIYHLSEIPIAMCLFGQQLQAAEAHASAMLSGDALDGTVPPTDPRTPPNPVPPESLEQWAGSRMDIDRVRRDILAGHIPIDMSLHLATEDLVRFVDDATAARIGRLISAQLVLAWTAFETLAGDLWIQAVNAHPETLAKLSAWEGGSAKSKDDGSGSQQEGKRVTLDDLARYRYDLRARMGTILKERFNFSKLEDIERAYRQAFPRGCRLNSEGFWTHRSIVSAYAVRNVIAHRGGVIDEKFRERCGKDDRFSHYRPDDSLILDGALVLEMVREIFSAGAQIIRTADDWIVTNPVKRDPDGQGEDDA